MAKFITEDGKLSAHYENTILITKKGVVLSFELTYNGTLKQKTVVHEVR